MDVQLNIRLHPETLHRAHHAYFSAQASDRMSVVVTAGSHQPCPWCVCVGPTSNTHCLCSPHTQIIMTCLSLNVDTAAGSCNLKIQWPDFYLGEQESQLKLGLQGQDSWGPCFSAHTVNTLTSLSYSNSQFRGISPHSTLPHSSDTICNIPVLRSARTGGQKEGTEQYARGKQPLEVPRVKHAARMRSLYLLGQSLGTCQSPTRSTRLQADRISTSEKGDF